MHPNRWLLLANAAGVLVASCGPNASPLELQQSSEALDLSDCDAAPSLDEYVNGENAFVSIDRTNTQIGASFNMRYTSNVKVNGVWYVYYITTDWSAPCATDRSAVGLATTTDGVNFTDHGLVLPVGQCGQWDNDYASFPGVTWDGTTFYMVYEGNGDNHPQWIGAATSTDGINWTKTGVLLYSGSQGSWDYGDVGTPAIYKVGTTWYLFFHGNSTAGDQIGVATGTCSTGLKYPCMTEYGGNPIIPVKLGWQVGAAGRMDITASHGSYFMAFEGADGTNGATARWSSGLAVSSDLLHWYTFYQNNVLPQTSGGNGTTTWGYGNDGPSFMNLGGATWIYYRSPAGDVTRRVKIKNDIDTISNQWNMSTSGISHETGVLAADQGWQVRQGVDRAGYLQYGPYVTLSAGTMSAVFKLKIDDNWADNATVLHLDVNDHTANNTAIATRDLTRREFVGRGDYQCFTVPFTVDSSRSGHSFEFRSHWGGTGNLTEAAVGYATASGNAMQSHWNAQSLPHGIGRADGDGWSANTAQDPQGYLTYGPYATMPTGDTVATFRIMIDNNSANNDPIVHMDVHDATRDIVLAGRDVLRQSWNATYTYEYFSVPYDLPSAYAGDSIEYRLWWYARAYVKEQKVGNN